MERSYTARDLIQLPRLSAREAVVLITEIETASQQAKVVLRLKVLPAPLQRALDRMLTGRDTLAAVLAPQTAEGDTQAKRKADRAVDNGWAALHAWLSGWCLLPAEKNPHLDEMVTLRELVFGKGLQFTQLPYKIEWQESKARLDAIARDGHARTLTKLGGGPFLEHLNEAQAAYGEVLGVTKILPELTETDIRSRQLAAMDAMRVFVTRASAHADPEVDGSEALAEKLLAPVVRWESRSATEAAEAGGAGTAGTPGTDMPAAGPPGG